MRKTTQTTNGEKNMTTSELIKQANVNASEMSNAYQNLIDTKTRKEAYSEWNKIRANYSHCAETKNGIICESTTCYRGSAMYFQNRFYKTKSDGCRGMFSHSKAIAILG